MIVDLMSNKEVSNDRDELYEKILQRIKNGDPVDKDDFMGLQMEDAQKLLIVAMKKLLPSLNEKNRAEMRATIKEVKQQRKQTIERRIEKEKFFNDLKRRSKNEI